MVGPAGGGDMGAFWDARARENALFFVDDRLDYRSPDAEAFWAYGETLVAGVLDLFSLAIAPSDRVLDLGCGVGRLTRALAARAGEVLALDTSGEMLARAREHNPELANVTWMHGDGTTLSQIGDASVDGALSLVVFQHIPNPAVTAGYIAELGRILRPGGWAAFQVSTDPSAHAGHDRPPVSERAQALLGRAPRGQDDPRWRGSALALEHLEATVADAGLELERLENPRTLYTLVLARRR
jgi:SAM-dependent methyltransferase